MVGQYMKSKRQIQKENTRQNIIDTAYRVYTEMGFGATTAVIAKEAGISHGAVFSHFQSVNELLECLIENFGHALAVEIHDLAESSGSVEELLQIHLDVLIRHEGFYTRLITERSLLPQEVQYTFANTQSTFAHHFGRIFEQEIESQTVKDIPVHLLLHTWLGMIHYYLWNKDLFAPGEPVLKRYSEELIITFLKLIKNK
jgi:AcrR family transcriptional regulator